MLPRDFFRIKMFVHFLLLLFAANLSAQNIAWVIPVGGPAEDEILSVCSDPEGNVIITGRYRNTINLNSEYSLKIFPGHYDCFVAKYSPTGQFIWGKEFGGESDDEGVFVNTDDQGNVYVIANSQSKILKFHGYDLSGKLNNKVVLIKINSNGRFEWARKIVEGNSLTQAVSVAGAGPYVCISGQYGAGTINLDHLSFTNMGNMDIFYAMYNAKDGTLLWAQVAGQKGNDFADKVAIDAEGNMLLSGRSVGQFGEDIYIGNQSIPLHVSYTSFLVRIDINGNILWKQRLFGQSGVYTDGLSYTPSGDIYLSGFVNAGRHTLIDSVYTTTSKGNQFVVKLSNKGERIWARTFGFSDVGRINNLTVDGAGNCLIGGWMRGNALFGEVALNPDVDAIQRLFAARISPLGEPTGAWQGGNNVHTGAGSVIAAGPGNKIYLSGYYSGEEIRFGRYELRGAGPTDSYIACLLAETPQIAEQSQPKAETAPVSAVATLTDAKPAETLREEETKEPEPAIVPEPLTKTEIKVKPAEPKPVEPKLAEKPAEPQPVEKPVEKPVEPKLAEKPAEPVPEKTPEPPKPALATPKPPQEAHIKATPPKPAPEPEEKKVTEAPAKTPPPVQTPPDEKPEVKEPVKASDPPKDIKPEKEVTKKPATALTVVEIENNLVTPNPSTGIIKLNLPPNTTMVMIMDAENNYVFHDFTRRTSAETITIDLSNYRGEFSVIVKYGKMEIANSKVNIKN